MGKEKNGNSKGVMILLIVIVVVLSVLVALMATGVINFKFSFNSSNQPTSENDTIREDKQSNTTNDSDVDDDDKALSNSNVVSQKSSVSTSQILSYYKNFISNFSNHLCSVADINSDGIPELFIFTTGSVDNEIVAYTSVFTYDENQGNQDTNYMVGIGTIKGRIDTNTVLYKMNDGRLLSVYGHMGYESTEYFKLENDWLVRTEFSLRQTDNYISGDTAIQFKQCGDTSLFDNIIS